MWGCTNCDTAAACRYSYCCAADCYTRAADCYTRAAHRHCCATDRYGDASSANSYTSSTNGNSFANRDSAPDRDANPYS